MDLPVVRFAVDDAMSVSGLLTVAEAAALRAGKPIPKGPTKLDRVIERKATKRDDDAKLAAWALAVKERDGWKCRKTKKKLLRTRRLDPLRAEAHHIASRADEAVRYDPRNGITLSMIVHQDVEQNKLRIVGTQWFVVGGKRYIDGRHPVKFEVIP
jgi:hypothetical protein